MNTIPYLAYDASNPLRLLRLGSWPDSVHIFDRDSAYALAAAEAARRPLLVRGEPGTGKSQLARAAAVARQRLFLSVVLNARTTAQDLQWQFDAVGRLGEAQLLAHGQDPQVRQYLHPRRFLSPGPLWWVLDWHSAQEQWQECASPLEAVPLPPEGWQPGHGSVVLIDEIDKADTDLPNGLLEILGNGDFTVPYLRTSVRQAVDSPPPLVIIPPTKSANCQPRFCAAVWSCHWPCPRRRMRCSPTCVLVARPISARSVRRPYSSALPNWCGRIAPAPWPRRCRLRGRRSIWICCVP
jgi:MoxR-like ATPase